MSPNETSHHDEAQVLGWTEEAITLAEHLTQKGRQMYHTKGLLLIHPPEEQQQKQQQQPHQYRWPIRIQARPLTEEETSSTSPEAVINSNNSITKIIHFQRHGQGVHNTICEAWRTQGRKLDLTSLHPELNPFLDEHTIDPPLTDHGRTQCHIQRQRIVVQQHQQKQQQQLVIVSPLTRTLQTAQYTWTGHHSHTNDDDDYNHNDNIKIQAHEACREDLGVLRCNQRQSRSTLIQQFPNIDFSLLDNDHDTLFQHTTWETPTHKAQRIYDFMTNYIRQLPQQEIVIVTHAAWLFCLCQAVMELQHPETMGRWFLTAEIRSWRITFTPWPSDNNQLQQEHHVSSIMPLSLVYGLLRQRRKPETLKLQRGLVAATQFPTKKKMIHCPPIPSRTTTSFSSSFSNHGNTDPTALLRRRVLLPLLLMVMIMILVIFGIMWEDSSTLRKQMYQFSGFDWTLRRPFLVALPKH
jgi:broad specificity phosphatase PhoE